MPSFKKAVASKGCVACGCCAKVCPTKAITIYKGLRAVVNCERCVGCGRCATACPADVITVKEVKACEKAVV